MRKMTQSETTVITVLLRFHDICKAKNKLAWSESPSRQAYFLTSWPWCAARYNSIKTKLPTEHAVKKKNPGKYLLLIDAMPQLHNKPVVFVLKHHWNHWEDLVIFSKMKRSGFGLWWCACLVSVQTLVYAHRERTRGRERLTEDGWRVKEMRELESWERNREEGERKVLCLAHH